MKYVFLVPFAFLCIGTTAQNLKVTYGVQANEQYVTEKNDSIQPGIKKIFETAKEDFKHINYTLIIDEGKSMFSITETMGIGNNLKIASSLAGFNLGSYFSDSEQEIKLWQVHGYGQLFLISSKFELIKWQITHQTKKINGLKTYKAYGHETVEGSSGIHKIKITAWFAPKISKPFGPGGYGNLPGLILELHRGGKTYQVKKLEETQEEVEKPTEGKKITKEEFVKIGREMNEQR